MWGLQMHCFVLLRFWCSLAIFGHLWPSGIGGICASHLGLCGRAEFQHHKWSPEGAPGSGGREWQMAWSTESSKMESKEYENYERIEWKTDENRYLGGQGPSIKLGDAKFPGPLRAVWSDFWLCRQQLWFAAAFQNLCHLSRKMRKDEKTWDLRKDESCDLVTCCDLVCA